MLSKIRKWFQAPSGAHVQVLSDLHLEVGSQYATYTFPVAAPFLLLVGDIGRLIDYDAYLEFLVTQVSRFDKVFLILGNHEFYGLEFQSGIDEAQRLSKEPALQKKLVLLHKSRWDDPDSNLTILGCTLWSSVPETAFEIVEYKISDFKKIQNWTVHDHNRVHADELEWLCDQVSLAKESNRTILVATHHAPCIEGTSRPEHAQNPWTSAFASELLGDNSWEGVKVWVFGHTHYTTRFTRRGIELVANQRGYVLPGGSAQVEGGNTTVKVKKQKNTFDPFCTITV
ncbi:unnamed protein product [Clonostachys rosea f. rosea IK726]|jgi:predicted phosphodiesterase|uniref:Uncharacterized protein n=1 Tax=Clonostachys rosea f. rosea IK726 TaxID=1349383 RepID=A0ACA9UXB5_BIOOC|nr:unnamed protein product [Clonostachys rosea f. rosea IK726]